MKNLDVFAQWSPINLDLIKAEDNDKKSYYIEGIASTENVDTSGEVIKQDGLDWSYAIKNGCFNYDHQNDAKNILGAPTAIAKTFVEGTKATIIKGILYGTKQIVKDLIENMQAMKAAGNPRQLGFSIEGQVISRDPKNPKIITRARVLNCAITHTPCNTDAVVSMVKNVLGQIEIQKAYPNEIAIRLQNPDDYEYFRRVNVPENHHWSEKFGKDKVAYIYGMDKKTKTLEIQAIRIRVSNPDEYSEKEIIDYLEQRKLNYIKIEMPKDYEKGYKMKKEEMQDDEMEMKMEHSSMSEEDLSMSDDSMSEESEQMTAEEYAALFYQYAMAMKKLLDEMDLSWGSYKKMLENDKIEIDPSKFVSDDDYQTNDKEYKQIEKEEGSIAPIVEQSLEGVEDKLMDKEDYELDSEELKMLIQRMLSSYPELSDDKIIALIAKIIKK